jgi:serine protease Do
MNNQLYDNQSSQWREVYDNDYDYDYEYDKPIGSYIKPVKREKRTPIIFRIIGAATLFGIVAALAFMLTTMFGGTLGDAIFPNDNGGIFNLGNLNRGDEVDQDPMGQEEGGLELTRSVGIITTDVSEIVEFAMPSVVSITNLTAIQSVDFFEGTQVFETASAGSGFIVAINEEELLIVTNDHVVAGHETLFITFNDESVTEAYIKGTKPEYDLAVVVVPVNQITRGTMDSISVAAIGDSDTLRMGEPAIAIGNALGYGQTVTMGVISALNRVSTAVNQEQHVEFANVELIQTDAAINPGNSGGPLMNARGEVIGINSSKLVGYQIEGVGYAIPISDVTWIINDLMNRATRIRVQEDLRGFLGISGSSVTANMATQHDIPQGVLINEIIEGGGAAGAGLEAGSIITELEGQTITSMEHLQWELDFYAVGEIVELAVYSQHNDEYIREIVSVQLGERPVSDD